MTALTNNFSPARRDVSHALNAVCARGGKGTAQRIARVSGLSDGQISLWRRGKKVSHANFGKLVRAIEVVGNWIDIGKPPTSEAREAPPAANSNGHTGADAAEFVRQAIAAPPVKAPQPFVVRSFAELRTLQIAKREMVVAPWLPTQTAAMVYAWRGTGKSLLALSLAMSIAAGVDFLGWTIPQARCVAYIDGELSVADLMSRHDYLVKVMGFEPPPPRLRLVPMMDPEQPGRLNLADPRHHDAIVAAIGDAEVVIFDSSVSLWSGKEIEAWSIVQPFMLDLRRRGKTVIFLHQAGKNREQRGLSDYEDFLEASIQLAPPPRPAPGGSRFNLTFEKHRGFFGADAEPISVALGPDGWSWSPARLASADPVPMQGDAVNDDEGGDQHPARALRVLRELPDDRWKAASAHLKLDEGAVVIEKAAFQDAFAAQWRDDEGQSPKPETLRKTVGRVLAKLSEQKRIMLIRDGSKVWISWPTDGVP